MAEVFPRAPITEAVIDIRVELPGGMALADLEKLHLGIKDRYPGKKTRRMLQATFELKDEKEPLKTTALGADGFLFNNSEGTQVVQYRLDGFSFSRLPRYTRWEEVYPEAWRLWEIYRDATKPVRVTRLAVRYINSIDIPLKTFDYDDYLTAAPKIPEELPQLVEQFFTRVVVPFPEHGAAAIITQAVSEKPDPVKTGIILDIDVYAQSSLPPEDKRVDEIFGILREIKNRVFRCSITDKTRELFR